MADVEVIITNSKSRRKTKLFCCNATVLKSTIITAHRKGDEYKVIVPKDADTADWALDTLFNLRLEAQE